MKNTALGREVYGAFSYGNTLNQLIIVNLFIFLLSLFLKIGFNIAASPLEASEKMEEMLSWAVLSLRAEEFVIKPYGIITYMFVHVDFFHFLWNMVSLYVFGRIFREFLGSKRLLPVYLYGGFIGGMVTLLFNIIFPDTAFSGSYLLGASASVMAVLSVIAFLYPDLPLHMVFLGPVRLKYIALFVVVLDLVGIASVYNAGGHMAHFGGLLFGMFYAIEFKRKRDLAAGFIALSNRLSRKKVPEKVKMKVAYRRPLSDEEYNTMRVEKEATLDELLDKINDKGIKSLTRREKELLEKYSKE